MSYLLTEFDCFFQVAGGAGISQIAVAQIFRLLYLLNLSER